MDGLTAWQEDDERAVADAGLLITGTTMARHGNEQVTDVTVTLRYRRGRKLSTLVRTLVAGGECTDDVALLCAGATGRGLDHDTVAPSKIGTRLRQFAFGHIGEFDEVTETMLIRAWAARAGPGEGDLGHRHRGLDMGVQAAASEWCTARW